MNKFSYFALLYFVLTFAHTQGNFLSSLFGLDHSSSSHHPKCICSNNTTAIAQSYLSQTLLLINKLQANSTYNSVLQLESANFVSYLQNTTNQALLLTNCTVFLTNLKAAQEADQQAKCAREEIASNIQQQFQHVIRNATGSDSSHALDCNEKQEHRY